MPLLLYQKTRSIQSVTFCDIAVDSWSQDWHSLSLLAEDPALS